MTGYALLGAVLGGVSLAVFPEGQIRSELARFLYVVATPLLGGAMMLGLFWLRRRPGQGKEPVEAFLSGLVFVLPLVLLRFFFAHP